VTHFVTALLPKAQSL